MTIEELKTLAGSLYKNAEEATPIVGDGDKNEWMANRLDEIVDEKEPSLNCLLGFETTSEVTDFLEKLYEDRDKDITDQDLPCAAERPIEHDHVVSNKNHNMGTDRNKMSSKYDEDPDVIIEEEILIVGDLDTDPMQQETNRPGSSCGCSR